jgi:hypothetical protein
MCKWLETRIELPSYVDTGREDEKVAGVCFTRDMVCHGGHPLEVVEVSRWEETDERRLVDNVVDLAQSGGLMIYEYFLRQCLNDIKD